MTSSSTMVAAAPAACAPADGSPSPGVVGSLLAPFDRDVLDRDPSSICACTADLRIVFVNRAWTEFGRANGTGALSQSGVGAHMLASTPAVLRPFYDALFARAVASAEPVDWDYECSSPTTLRTFRMRVLKLASGGLLVSHSLLRAAPADATAASLDAMYRNAQGIVVQCAHCRRVCRVEAPRAWEWVPSFVEHMPARTSHGLCPICNDYYYPW